MPNPSPLSVFFFFNLLAFPLYISLFVTSLFGNRPLCLFILMPATISLMRCRLKIFLSPHWLIWAAQTGSCVKQEPHKNQFEASLINLPSNYTISF